MFLQINPLIVPLLFLYTSMFWFDYMDSKENQ